MNEGDVTFEDGDVSYMCVYCFEYDVGSVHGFVICGWAWVLF